MRPDPGRDLMEARLSALTRDERARHSAVLRERGVRLVWDQLDRAAVTDPVEQAMFLVSRMYPEMPAVHVEQLRQGFIAARERDGWDGPQRPPALPRDG
jgi:hypothetical protein